MLNNYYAQEYDFSPDKIYFYHSSYWKYKIRGRAFAKIAQKHINPKNVKNIFELGSGFGFNLIELKNIYKNASIFSDDPDKRHHSNKVKIGKLNQKKYDIILLSHVLEHVVFPKNIISEIINSLSINGICIIEVPNDNSFLLSQKIYDEPHITFFNCKSIETLFSNFSNEINIIEIYSSGLYINKKNDSTKIQIARNNYFQRKIKIIKDIPSKNEFQKRIERLTKKIPNSQPDEKQGNVLRLLFRKK